MTLDFLYELLMQLWNWTEYVVNYLWSYIVYVWDTLVTVATGLWNDVLWVLKKIWQGFDALLHLPFSSIWKKIKAIYDRYRRFRAWWQKHIQGPIDAYRRALLAIYRQYFKPIIDVIESLRGIVRIIAVFNRKLAAKLDSVFWKVEGWILLPITLAMRRINSMASIVYAILTITGRFDATVLVASVARHIGELRAALLGLPYKNTTDLVGDRPGRNAQIATDFKAWLYSGGGYIQDGVDAMTAEFQDALTRMGG